jgi:hypothetical protein
MNWNDRFSPLIAEIEAAVAAAYQRGWDDAVQAIMQAAQKPAQAVQQSLPLQHPRQVRPSGELSNSKTATPLIELVLNIVKTHPGVRGADIVTYATLVMPDKERKLLDRTVRTGLLRLKQRERIISIDGKWYAAEETETKN